MPTSATDILNIVVSANRAEAALAEVPVVGGGSTPLVVGVTSPSAVATPPNRTL